MRVRAWRDADVPAMASIWNEVVEDGVAFPQTEPLTEDEARAFFAAQTHCAVAEDDGGVVVGMYILHPNNIGRCGHIGNASYAVRRERRGAHIGELLVRDSLKTAKACGFRLMQFNAVVESNPARRLYERLGFIPLGQIPGGFRMKDGHYETICLYYHDLKEPDGGDGR